MVINEHNFNYICAQLYFDVFRLQELRCSIDEPLQKLVFSILPPPTID